MECITANAGADVEVSATQRHGWMSFLDVRTSEPLRRLRCCSTAEMAARWQWCGVTMLKPSAAVFFLVVVVDHRLSVATFSLHTVRLFVFFNSVFLSTFWSRLYFVCCSFICCCWKKLDEGEKRWLHSAEQMRAAHSTINKVLHWMTCELLTSKTFNFHRRSKGHTNSTTD